MTYGAKAYDKKAVLPSKVGHGVHGSAKPRKMLLRSRTRLRRVARSRWYLRVWPLTMPVPWLNYQTGSTRVWLTDAGVLLWRRIGRVFFFQGAHVSEVNSAGGEAGVKTHDIQPYFDMEGFMVMSQEKRLGGAVLERLVDLWGQWLPQLKVCEISAGKISYLAVWLPESIEIDVDEAWEKSASDGFMINNLAQFMCMSAVQAMLPQVEDAGCAPSPRPTEALRGALEKMGLEYRPGSSVLARRFAVVTHFPFRGGCEICHLQSECPKGQGQAESSSILLPGYERGADGGISQ